jgi:hypothetical protein
MRTIRFASLICLLTLTFSCAKEPRFLDVPGATYLKAKVNGRSVESKLVVATKYDANKIQIMGSNDAEAFNISLSNYRGVGKYSLSEDGTGVYISNVQDPGNTSFMTIEEKIGTVNITVANDWAVQGTFEFRAKALSDGTTRTITAGTFVANFSTKN